MNTPKLPQAKTGAFINLRFPFNVRQVTDVEVEVDVKPDPEIGRKVELFVDGICTDMKINSEEARNRIEQTIHDELLRAQLLSNIEIIHR